MIRVLLAYLALAAPLNAQGIEAADYTQLRQQALGFVDFEILPSRPEPGYNIDHGIAFAGGHVGTHFTGQERQLLDIGGTQFDTFDPRSRPSAPLSLETGPEGEGLSLAHHPGFGSMAIFPLGPAGISEIVGRGEGSVAVLFSEDTCQVGFLLHARYDDPFPTERAISSWVLVTLYDRSGAALEDHLFSPTPGQVMVAYRTSDSRTAIAGLTVENTDPGGIALDDLAFGPCAQILG